MSSCVDRIGSGLVGILLVICGSGRVGSGWVGSEFVGSDRIGSQIIDPCASLNTISKTYSHFLDCIVYSVRVEFTALGIRAYIMDREVITLRRVKTHSALRR